MHGRIPFREVDSAGSAADVAAVMMVVVVEVVVVLVLVGALAGGDDVVAVAVAVAVVVVVVVAVEAEVPISPQQDPYEIMTWNLCSMVASVADPSQEYQLQRVPTWTREAHGQESALSRRHEAAVPFVRDLLALMQTEAVEAVRRPYFL